MLFRSQQPCQLDERIRGGCAQGAPRPVRLCHHGFVSMGDIRQVPVTELPDDFTDEVDRVLLDVREDDEWAAGHVRGAVHIPLGDVPARIDEIDLDADLLVVCHSSGRSMRVLQYLAQLGYEGSCVRGGMLAWVENEKPVEAGSAGSK
ncbi:hypothetical protein GCM10022238_23480 [Gordonia hankookensis]